MSSLAFFAWRRDDIFDAERRSIAARDLFGKGLPADCKSEDDDASPMGAFLADLASRCGEGALQDWDGFGPPDFIVCRDAALELVGQDLVAAEAILDGRAPLIRMSADTRDGSAADRAQWAKSLADEYEAATEDALPNIEELVSELLNQSEGS